MSASEPLLFGYSDATFWRRFVPAPESFSVAPKGPFGIQLDERIRSYVAATDGIVLVAVPQEEASGLPLEALSNPGTQLRQDAARLLEAPPSYSRRRARAQALLEWCGEPLWPSGGPCPECGPEPAKEECITCGGMAEHECPTCDEVHDCGTCQGQGTTAPRGCGRCDGTGTETRVPRRVGRLLGSSVNRVYIGRIVEALAERPTSVVEIAATADRRPRPKDPSPIWIACGERRGVVMPLNVAGGHPFEAWLDAAEGS